MPWEEASPGKYTRELDNAELCLKTVATPFRGLDREHWAINFIASVRLNTQSTDETVAALQSAWIALRFHHPHIATVLEDDSITYQVPNEEDLRNWLSDSFFVHKDRDVEQYLSLAPWLRYTSLHYFPGRSELVIRIHHWLVDGVGAQHTAHRFFELLASGSESPTFGIEWKVLPPSLREVSNSPRDSSPERREAATKMFMDFASKMPSIGLPIDIGQETPGGVFCSTLEYPPTVLDTLLAACRGNGLSITAAVHAAIIVATQEMPQESSAKNYTTIACFDYRRYLQPPYNDVEAWPMGVYMLGLPASLPRGEFSLQAKELQKVYKQPLGSDEVRTMEYYDEYSSMITAALSQPPPPGMPLPTTPYLSSLGSIDRRVQARYGGKFPVQIEWTAIRTDVMTPSIAMYQWSWQKRFTISACYNEAYYKKTFVNEFMRRVENILFRGLGCPSVSST